MKRRYLSLLRALAIFAVFATHVILFCPPTLLDSLLIAGRNVSWILIAPAWGGVWILFALSGYLTGKGFAAGRYALTWAGCRRFWWNRFLRICIPYYFAVFVVVVFTAPNLLDPSGWPTLAHMLSFTYYDTTTGAPLGQTWFVSTLVQLMALAPLIALVMRPLLERPRRAALVACSVLLAGTLVRLAPLLVYPGTDLKVWWPSWMYVPVWANLDLFIAGYLLNAAVRTSQPRVRFWMRPVPVLALFAAVWVLTARLAYSGLTLGGRTSWTILAIAGPLVWVAVAALWIRMAEARPACPANAVASRSRGWFIVEVGAAISYGIYLWHVPSCRASAQRSTTRALWRRGPSCSSPAWRSQSAWRP